MKSLMKLREAAEETPFDEQTLRRAIRKPVDDGVFPPPLMAKVGSRGAYLVTDTALTAWIDSLPDA